MFPRWCMNDASLITFFYFQRTYINSLISKVTPDLLVISFLANFACAKTVLF